jgi:hypothetical protein
MNYKIIMGTLLLFITTSLFGIDLKDFHLQKWKLKGPVKKWTAIEWSMRQTHDTTGEAYLYEISTFWFNDAGFLTYHTIQSAQFGKIYELVIEYDDEGLISKLYQYGKDRKSCEIRTFQHFFSPRSIEKVQFDTAGNRKWKRRVFYDDKGNMIENQKLNALNTIEVVDKYTYNEYDDVIERVAYDLRKRKKVLHYKIDYEYDHKGNMLSKVEYYDVDKYHRSTYEYDGNGNLLLEIFYTDDNSISYKSQYEYDNQNNKITYSSLDEIDRVHHKELYSHDNYGNVILTRYFSYLYDTGITEEAELFYFDYELEYYD